MKTVRHYVKQVVRDATTVDIEVVLDGGERVMKQVALPARVAWQVVEVYEDGTERVFTEQYENRESALRVAADWTVRFVSEVVRG